jgi:hypothetical protein
VSIPVLHPHYTLITQSISVSTSAHSDLARFRCVLRVRRVAKVAYKTRLLLNGHLNIFHLHMQRGKRTYQQVNGVQQKQRYDASVQRGRPAI